MSEYAFNSKMWSLANFNVFKLLFGPYTSKIVIVLLYIGVLKAS